MPQHQLKEFESKAEEAPIFYRTFHIDTRAIDEDKRTVPLSFSSEEPFERYFGVEILSHDPKDVDLSFLASGRAPLLKDHWMDEQIGVIESARIEGKKGRAVVRFSKRANAEDEFQDVKDGIRTCISVGYQIKEKTLIKEDPSGTKTYRVKWRPLEISTVSIPADEKVGVGRGNGKEHHFTTNIFTQRKGAEMPEEVRGGEVPKPDFDANAIEAARNDAARQAEDAFLKKMAKRDKEVREILSIGERLQFNDEARSFVKEGKSLDEFKNFVLDKMEKQNARPPEQAAGESEIGMSRNDREKYSFMRALRAVCLGPKDPRFLREAAFEFECSAAAAKRQGKEADGLIIPHDMLKHRYNSQLYRRTLTAGTATDGAELVADNLLAGSFIDVLRNLSISMQLGAITLDGLVGDVLIPRKTSGAAAGWISTEGGNAANSEAQFDQVSLKPKTGGVYTDLSRQLLMQSTPAAEGLIRDDLAKALTLLIDKAAFYGTGSNGQPKGISQQTGINEPTAFSAAVPTWAEVVALESAVAVDNALLGTLGYAIDPAMRGSLKTTEKASGTAKFIMEENNRLNGYNCAVSSQITSGDVFFGNFADLLIAFWGGLDVLVDPYTNSLSGTVRIVAHQSCDVAVRHPVSFAFNNDDA